MKSKPTLPLLPPSGLGLPKALQPTTAPPAHHVHKLPKKKKLVQRSSLEPTICTQIKTRGARGSSTGTTAGKKRSKKPPAPEHPLSIDFSGKKAPGQPRMHCHHDAWALRFHQQVPSSPDRASAKRVMCTACRVRDRYINDLGKHAAAYPS